MLIEIRHPREEELPAFIDARSTAFLERPDVDKVAAEVRPLWDLNRLWAAFDGGHMCATFRSWPTELTVPGDERLPASAITNVTVLPTHRRRGMLRSMMAAEHDAIRERGEVLGLLRSAEYPIYGRFGYGPGCLSATWTLNTRVTAFHGNPTGSVELVLPSEDARDAMKGASTPRAYDSRARSAGATTAGISTSGSAKWSGIRAGRASSSCVGTRPAPSTAMSGTAPRRSGIRASLAASSRSTTCRPARTTRTRRSGSSSATSISSRPSRPRTAIPANGCPGEMRTHERPGRRRVGRH